MTDPAKPIDFAAQTRVIAALAEGVREDQLADPTPCEDMAVRNLLGHLIQLSTAFAAAARKEFGPLTDTAPGSAVPDIGPAWRTELSSALAALTEAWRSPDAWQGMTRAGGVDLPGGVAGQVAMDELVIHGWDLARATGQPYAPDAEGLDVAYGLLDQSRAPEDRGEIFGPVVDIPDEAPLLDRAVGLSGRHPDWTPPGDR
ncbi:TIGR03086 family metal-binding protein [Streptomyces sp. NPDC002851]